MLTTVRALRVPLIWSLAVATLLSCGGAEEEKDEASKIGSVAQAIDTDSDGMDDAWETTHFGNLSRTGSADYDSDGMTDLEEYTYGFDPTVGDGFDDADGDRYPNVYELRNGSDPTLASSVPTAGYVVDGSGGGTHTTVSAAHSAANSGSNNYPIIGIAAGTYTGSSNLNISINTTKKPLIIGLEGAAKTIFDQGNGWWISTTSVISSLTFQRISSSPAFYLYGAGTNEFRIVDVVVRDSTPGSSYATAVQMDGGAKTFIVGSTFINNAGHSSKGQIYVGTGQATILNSVLWASALGPTPIVAASGTTLTTSYSLSKGQTLTGTGNISGSTDPKLRADGRLLFDSPLRGAGGSHSFSRLDMDLEIRSSSTPDIGVDQFVDSDSDDLADAYEIATSGNLTTLTSATADGDSDGLTNQQEYANRTNATMADTDGDGLSDGDEVTTHGTSPIVVDTDGDEMPDGWEVNHGLSATTANPFEDADGDRYPNIYEYTYSTDPSDSASTPTPTYIVNGAGGGTHTTLSAAHTAANSGSIQYPIIGIAAGTYTGFSNLGISINTTKKPLIIGLEGAAKTIFDQGSGWYVSTTAVISSITFQRITSSAALNLYGVTANEFRIVDVVVKDSTPGSSYATAVQVDGGSKTFIVNSTFVNNTGHASRGQIYIGTGQATILNSVLWASASGPTPIVAASGTTLTTNYCLSKGQTLTGTGNLSGSTDPKLRADGRLLFDSPLRAAGGSHSFSRLDIDLELRSSTTPDIGADQFVDSDSDDLADAWEVAVAGNLTTLTSATADGDSDGLTNQQEYANSANPAVADTDGDGLSDGDEVLVHGTDPTKTDTDGDEMPDAWEVAHGLSATTADAFEDADGDRYPNIHEYAYSTDPSDRASIPTPTYVVSATGGGTHTTVNAAVSAAGSHVNDYPIIGIQAGVYGGSGNVGITINSSKKLLIIGLDGAAKTIFDQGDGWQILSTAVVSSLTFQRMRTSALYVSVFTGEVRFNDLLIRQNGNASSSSWATGIHFISAQRAFITGTTFLENWSHPSYGQIYVGGGSATIRNTVVWSSMSGSTLLAAGGTSLTTSNCLVKGLTLSGTGNLAGTTNPKINAEGRLRWDSPLRGAGGIFAQSRIDMDGELRPLSTPDIGVDQIVDSDSDELPDSWEMAYAGNLTTLVSATQDNDSDGLTNAEEYEWDANPLDPDTDNDGIEDGNELTYSMNPAVADADDLVTDDNQDGLIDNIGGQLGHQPNQADDDGDGVSNADEILMCTNPFRADTDGDGVPDNTDVFPHDPLMSSLPTNGSDTTAPVITLTAPWNAVLQ